MIENDFLRIEISTLGAELQSVFNKKNNTELLWQGDPSWWPRKAPILFPTVGKLNGNKYRVANKAFSLPQHGFARDMEFIVGSRTSSSATMLLRANDETRKIYPFDFELRIVYRLDGPTLTVEWEVSNPGDSDLLFSIGAHPGFNCPLNDNEDPGSYFLQFEKQETLTRHLLTEGLFNGATEAVLTNSNILSLFDELFRKDAIVLKDLRSEFIELRHKERGMILRFSFRLFPYFGIWRKPGAAFICLEPWCGLADNTGFSGEFKDKEGVNQLGKGQTFRRQYSIAIPQ